jgi:hypothetical protein
MAAGSRLDESSDTRVQDRTRRAGVIDVVEPAAVRAFGFDRGILLDRSKYSKFHDLLIAHVWNVSEPVKTKIYVLNQDEALRIANEVHDDRVSDWQGRLCCQSSRPGVSR